MKEEQKDLIAECVEALGADGYRKGKSWKGYEIYIPDYKKPVYIGFPYVVMVKEEEVRLSTEEESLDYLSYSEGKGAEEEKKETPSEEPSEKEEGRKNPEKNENPTETAAAEQKRMKELGFDKD